MRVNVKILCEAARQYLPTYATEGSAALDLHYVGDDTYLTSGQMKMLGTGIAIEIPEAHCGLIIPRSGLSTKHGLVLANTAGLIDSDYRGEIKVALKNGGYDGYIVKAGERIAQMLIMPVALVSLVVVDEIGDTDRGAGGFGSTGS